MLVDFYQLACIKMKIGKDSGAILNLFRTAGANEGRRHAGIAQNPSKGHLGKRLAAPLCNLVEALHADEHLVIDKFGFFILIYPRIKI